MTCVWRAMMPSDLARVEAIATIVHPRYPESDAVPRERLALFPAGCLIAEAAGAAAGYLVSHPWHVGRAPTLDTLLGAIPVDANCLYLHDLALLPAARGGGTGAAAVARLRAVAAAHGLRHLALIAVNESGGFWRRQGFAEVAPDRALAAALASYDADAAYMIAGV